MMEDAVTLWLKSAARFKLLTPAQELEAARQVRAWLDCDAPSPQVVKAGRAARERLVNHNLRLVVTVAKPYVRRTALGFEDLLQAGAIGLQRAAEKFHPTKGYRFSTYAHPWIRQGITRTMVEQRPDCASRLPSHIYYKRPKVKRAIAAHTKAHGKRPNEVELGELLAAEGVSPETWEYCQRWASSSSLDLMVGGDGSETRLGDLIADSGPSPEDAAIAAELSERVGKALEILNPRQQQVLELSYGLADHDPQTASEIGALIGISGERVRQIREKSMRRLRHLQAVV